jgi:hypothetical protein
VFSCSSALELCGAVFKRSHKNFPQYDIGYTAYAYDVGCTAAACMWQLPTEGYSEATVAWQAMTCGGFAGERGGGGLQ